MPFIDLARRRASIRGYRPDPVSPEALQQVLEAAVLAPTAANRQAFRLIVCATDGRREELSRIYSREWFLQAPYVIAICVEPARAWVRQVDGHCYAEVDAGIVFDHLTLAAADLGLGTCWIGAFDPEAAREVLALPEGVVPVAFTPLGWPDAAPRQKQRRSLEEMVSYDRW